MLLVSFVLRVYAELTYVAAQNLFKSYFGHSFVCFSQGNGNTDSSDNYFICSILACKVSRLLRNVIRFKWPPPKSCFCEVLNDMLLPFIFSLRNGYLTLISMQSLFFLYSCVKCATWNCHTLFGN